MQYFVDTIFYLSLILPPGGTEHELKIVIHRTVGEQLEILKYDTQLTTQLRNMLALDMQHIISQHLGIARRHIQFTVKGFEQTRLTRTDFTDEVDKLSLM